MNCFFRMDALVQCDMHPSERVSDVLSPLPNQPTQYVMLSERIDSLSEEVDRQQEEQQRQQWLLEQQSQQAQQQQGAQQHQGASQQRGPYGPELGSSSSNSSSSSSGGISRDVGRSGGSPAAPASGVGSGRTVVGPAPPAWQQARQQQRRSMATWAV